MFPVSATPSKLSTGKINITLKLKNYWGDNTLDDLKKLIGLFDIPSCCIHLKRIGVGSVLVLLLCSTTVAKELKGAIDKAADLLKTKGVLQVFVEEEILLEFPQPYQGNWSIIISQSKWLPLFNRFKIFEGLSHAQRHTVTCLFV